jgi:CcmD family protein
MKGVLKVWGAVALTVLLAAGAWGATLAAQGEEGFVPLKEGESLGEQLPATPLVFGAYAAVWVLLLVYVYSLWRRIVRAERELSDINAQLEARQR